MGTRMEKFQKSNNKNTKITFKIGVKSKYLL